MLTSPLRKLPAALALALAVAGPAHAQFLDTFDGPAIPIDPEGLEGWSFFTGDGEATMDLQAGGQGHASIVVDATRDHRGIWWALVKRRVSGSLDLAPLERPGYELRIEARVRASHAPRRVNLHLNTQRTTDFHSHLMEFDLPEVDEWHTISMTTRDFDARPGDTVFGQLALMDWGSGRYRVDVDYLKVDVVEAATAPPDVGEAVPYHPPIPDPGAFGHAVGARAVAVVDREYPDVNLHGWGTEQGKRREPLLTVSGTQLVVLRFDLAEFAGKRVSDRGLLELTTHSVLRAPTDLEEFGKVRVVEILGGDPAWGADSVTLGSLCRGEPLDDVLNSQMVIDWAVEEAPGARTHFTISRPVLQRLVDGRTLGLAIRPLGAVVASFRAGPGDDGGGEPRLLFDVED
jgi:hypothetical protein